MADGSQFALQLRTLLLPLAGLMSEAGVTEIVINTPGEVLVETRTGWRCVAAPEMTYDHLLRVAAVIASCSGQKISAEKPLLSATLPDGERVQVARPPAVGPGLVSMTIRKPSTTTYSLDQLDDGGLFADVAPAGDKNAADATLREMHSAGQYKEFLKLAVLAKKNIIISGATGSGKTTISKGLIAMIPVDERIITIEDTHELVIPQPNNVRLYYSKGDQGAAQITAKSLLESCLRMRPDRILLQELRDGTAWDYLRNVNSGHPGSITTVHADSARLAFEQLMLLVKESEGGRGLAREDIHGLLTMLVDVVVQCKKVKGKGHRVTEVYYADRQGRRVTDAGGATAGRA